MSNERAEAQRKILNRLKRARGQLDAVIRAVESGQDCKTVVTQLAATNSAIQRAGFTAISTTMRECVSGDENPDASIAELEKLFLSLS